jgi:hypothetical protein
MIKILKVNGPPPPAVAARPAGESVLVTPAEGVPRIYVSDRALAAIRRHIGWGEVTDENVVEQGGLLIGHLFLDEAAGEPFAVVEHAIAAKASHSSATFIDMNHATLGELYRELDALEPPPDGPPWRVLGWYHTHPNELPVFMSSTDRRTQSDFFSGPEHFAFVFNPHRLLWKVFQGAACLECSAVAFGPAQGGVGEEKPAQDGDHS